MKLQQNRVAIEVEQKSQQRCRTLGITYIILIVKIFFVFHSSYFHIKVSKDVVTSSLDRHGLKPCSAVAIETLRWSGSLSACESWVTRLLTAVYCLPLRPMQGTPQLSLSLWALLPPHQREEDPSRCPAPTGTAQITGSPERRGRPPHCTVVWFKGQVAGVTFCSEYSSTFCSEAAKRCPHAQAGLRSTKDSQKSAVTITSAAQHCPSPLGQCVRRGEHQGLFGGSALFPALHLVNVEVITGEPENKVRLGLAMVTS